jgi:hypothetical protein
VEPEVSVAGGRHRGRGAQEISPTPRLTDLTYAAPRRPRCPAVVFPAASAFAAASAEEDDEQKNLKRELLRAQEEVKRIQSVPRARGEGAEEGAPSGTSWWREVSSAGD